MATTLVSTGVQFPDGSTQTTAAVSSNTANSVGSYCLALTISNAVNVAFGGTRAGSQLTPQSAYLYESSTSWASYYNAGGLAGTWRCMGQDPSGNYGVTRCGTLWIRIS